jgi:hypothetical protein
MEFWLQKENTSFLVFIELSVEPSSSRKEQVMYSMFALVAPPAFVLNKATLRCEKFRPILRTEVFIVLTTK